MSCASAQAIAAPSGAPSDVTFIIMTKELGRIAFTSGCARASVLLVQSIVTVASARQRIARDLETKPRVIYDGV